jgi:pyruvyl transferase EpsO
MSQNVWLNCMVSLKEKHKAIAQLVAGKSIAYVDIATHFNVGDLLIYRGTEAFFKQYNLNVVYRSGTSGVDFEQLKKVDVILLHGGGNFGDLYPKHQKLRERIVSTLNNKKVICLPQSIHFDSEMALKDSALLFSKHPDFHFFVRDAISFDIAKKFTANVKMMPDMAHSLHPLVDMREVGRSNIMPPRILNLVRVDKESKGKVGSVNKLGFDWVNIITKPDYWTIKLYYKMIKFPFLRTKATKVWGNLCDDIIFRSINFFSSHTIVHTDRLHGLILSALLGKEVYLKDNSYGKNSNYYEAWLKEYPYLEMLNKD